MKIVECHTDIHFSEFYKVPELIYRGDPEYVAHIKQDIQGILRPREANDRIKLFLLEKDKAFIGRVAAFVKIGQKRGGIGFFECTDDIAASELLFRAAEGFLQSLDCKEVEGPVNFGERDKYWGLLVKGFKNPSYQENYNPPYYQHLFEENGYDIAFEQSTQEITPQTFNEEVYQNAASRIKVEGFNLKHFVYSERKKFANDFVEIYNAAWAIHEHFEPMTQQQILRLIEKMKPVMREDLLWFTYHGEKPVAFYFSIIELNQIMRHLNGNLNWLGKLKFLYYRRKEKIKRIKGVVFGVNPDYQGRGVTSAMIMKVFQIINKDPNLESSELAWIGDFNPRMLKFLSRLGAYETKRHATLRKTF